MAFSGSDNPIAELVWSPQNGVSLRCANNSSPGDKTPFFVWNMGSNGEDLPPSHESMKSDCNGVNTLIIQRAELVGDDDNAAAATCNQTNNNVEEVSKEKSDSKVSEAFVGTNHPNMPLPISALPLRPISALPLRREKGKETALSDESAESCNNSVGSFSKCIVKRQRNDDLMMHGSKRMKRKTRMDISFMRWISNMGKSLPVKEDSSSFALSKAHHYEGVSNSGFQSIFQSLKCRDMDISNNEVRNDYDSSEECRKIHDISENSCKQIVVVSEKEVRNPTTNVGQSSTPWIFSRYISRVEKGNEASNSLGKQVNSSDEKAIPEKDTPLKSLWITRFSPVIEKHDGCTTNRPNSNAKNVKYSKSFPLHNIAPATYKVVPSGIFRAIRNLRLSRSDVLRWMDSNVSLSNLNGFFVRLRLGKMEEGIRATYYYIARITGDVKEHNVSRSTKTILVDVGGIKSSVESRYVSNQEFLEDEIKAWWCRTVDNGCIIP